MLMMAVHVLTWYVLDIHVVGSIGIEAFFSGLSRGVINAGFIFWISVVIATVVLGRAFCGWFCWFGGYLDLVEWGRGKLKISIPHRMLLYLVAIPFVSLALKIYNTIGVTWLQGFPTTFIFQLADVEPWGGQQTGISIVITLIMFGPVLHVVFGRRAWCRYLCPIGALLKVFSKLGAGKVRLVNDDCIGCGTCNRICDMQVDVLGALKSHGAVSSTNCIRCLKCIDTCPKKSIGFSMSNTKASLSIDTTVKAEQLSLTRRKFSSFDVAVMVLWISATFIFNIVGVSQNSPQEIKVLMTPGLLLVTYGFVWLVQRVWSRWAYMSQHVLTS
jgi:polyferredoxin